MLVIEMVNGILLSVSVSSVITFCVVMLSVILPSEFILNAVMLSVVMLSVVMMIAAAPTEVKSSNVDIKLIKANG